MHKDALHYIADNYTKEITWTICVRYNINKFYFQKLFKRYTNTTPNQYLITNRLCSPGTAAYHLPTMTNIL